MTLFDRYAAYYDLLYADKNYAAEADFVTDKIRAYVPAAKSILDLGCGNARHAMEFASAGYTVKGIDKSSRMLRYAQAIVDGLPDDVCRRITLAEADVTDDMSFGDFDAVVALFHVANYQLTNDALLRFFKTARKALKPGGIFLFDFWYGPAVLTERPEKRIKRIDGQGLRLVRTATPEMDVNRNVVIVNYEINVDRPSEPKGEAIVERHEMRYLFLPEIALLSSLSGFEVSEQGAWMSTEALDQASWYGYTILRAVE